MIRPILFALFVLGTSADPQGFGGFGGFGVPKIPSVPTPPAALAAIPGVAELSEYTQKVQALVTLTKDALTDMGNIAVADDPEVGGKIVAKLSQEIEKVVKIFAEYTAEIAGFGGAGRRRRRDANSSTNNALDKTSGVLAGSNEKIQPEKEQLKPETQEEIDARYVKAMEECGTDVCKSQLAEWKQVKAARDAKKAKKG